MKAAAHRSSARSDATTTVIVGDRINVAGTQSTSSSDPLEVFRQAALTFQTPPAIYQRQRLGLEDLPKVWPAQDGAAPSRAPSPTSHTSVGRQLRDMAGPCLCRKRPVSIVGQVEAYANMLRRCRTGVQ